MSWNARHAWSVGEVLTAANHNNNDANLDAIAAVGSLQFVIAASAGAATSNVWQGGWLECNAAAVSRTTYSALHVYLRDVGGASSYKFGSGDGSTTFNVPDLRGRVPIHQAANATVSTLANSDGVADANRRGTLHKHTPHTHTVGGSANDTTATAAANRLNNIGTTYATGSSDGGSGISTDPLDGGAYLVAGIWVVKF